MNASGLLAAVMAARGERARAAATHAAVFAPSFNAVELLGANENALSAAFRWMLDERASHGQGAVFRTLFLGQFVPDAASAVDWSGAGVQCEVMTRDGAGRIDLLITGRSGDCVAVENKPWAGWQGRQLDRYWHDRQTMGGQVWVHALIGGVADPEIELDRHWREDGRDGSPPPPRPTAIGASSYGEVVCWIEACAAAARPERVRSFLFDLAAYCRRTIVGEPAMTELHATAALIADGGPAALDAAREIEAALPEVYRLLTEGVAERIAGGTSAMVGSYRVLRFPGHGIPFAAALFGGAGLRPWIGVTDPEHADALAADLPWGRAEKLWPKWVHLDQIGTAEARAAIAAIGAGDLDGVAAALPALAGQLVGPVPVPPMSAGMAGGGDGRS